LKKSKHGEIKYGYIIRKFNIDQTNSVNPINRWVDIIQLRKVSGVNGIVLLDPHIFSMVRASLYPAFAI